MTSVLMRGEIDRDSNAPREIRGEVRQRSDCCSYRPRSLKSQADPSPRSWGDVCLAQTLPPSHRRNPPCPHLDLELLASRLRGNKSQLLSPPGIPGGSVVKNPPAMQETRVRSLGQEDSLEKEMATHSSILDWKIPWTEELGRLQPLGLQRVRHNSVTKLPPPRPPVCSALPRQTPGLTQGPWGALHI